MPELLQRQAIPYRTYTIGLDIVKKGGEKKRWKVLIRVLANRISYYHDFSTWPRFSLESSFFFRGVSPTRVLCFVLATRILEFAEVNEKCFSQELKNSDKNFCGFDSEYMNKIITVS